MHIWKNTKDISIVLFMSIGATLFLYLFLRGPIELNFNSSLLYKDNYGKSSDSIVIVRVDNQTLDALQKTDIRVLNLTKTVFSKTIERLEESGVKAIGIDIIFANLATDADILANTLQRYKNIVIAAKVGNPSTGDEKVLPLDIYSGATW
jgi:CHASE2 domain-containing sensor protein